MYVGGGLRPEHCRKSQGRKKSDSVSGETIHWRLLEGFEGKFGMNRPVLFTIVQSKSVNFVPIVTRVAVSVPVNETSMLPAVS